MLKIIACFLLLGCTVLFCSASDTSEKTGELPWCGKNGTKSNGSFKFTFQSNFTGECVFIIQPVLNETQTASISLYMHYLYLYDGDAVTVFKDIADVGNDSLSLIAPLHAQNESVTIVTNETKLVIKFKGVPKAPYHRKFEGLYEALDCIFPLNIDPDQHIQLIHSPIVANNLKTSIECKYTFNHPDVRTTAAFHFKEFKMSSSEVSLKESTKDGPYNGNPPVDFFPANNHTLEIDVTMKLPTNDYFCLQMKTVDSGCSGYKKIQTGAKQLSLSSPPYELNNGPLISECYWVVENSENPDSSKSLGVVFDKLHLENAIDIISINDGASEQSPPLVQVTISSGNITNNQLIRSTGPFLWVAFKPNTYASSMSAIISSNGQGGYYKGNGNIQMKSSDAAETVYLLEVEENQIVYLKFDDTSDFPMPATLSIYDGFDRTNLLATLHGKVWYPVLSKSSKMMLIATAFVKGSFRADFNGVSPSCLHMGTFSNENYILSGNCNSTCQWVIPPQDQPNTNLMINLQYLALSKSDSIKVSKLDAAKTVIGDVSSSLGHVPQLMVPANVGALVEINRAPCTKENGDIVVVGHSSYLPACGNDLLLSPGATVQISSPLHPDTYPIYANCKWNITSTSKDNLLHLGFHSLKLAPTHCVKVTHSADNKTEEFVRSDLPGDLFLTGSAVVEFDSGNCTKTKGMSGLVSSEGFVLNGTVVDCGSVLSGKGSGTFTVPANKTLCIWKVSVPETGLDASDNVNIISYSVTKNDDKGNYELDVYDGNSVRDNLTIVHVNDTKSDIWSRTSDLIFVYKRIDIAKPSTLLTVKFETISCNSTMQCDNKVCMHPDWRCNGLNDCGDYTDERNCNTVPIPPVIKKEGYSATTFWVTLTVMLAVGAALGFGVPVLYQRHKNGQYRRFGEISIIE